MTATASRWSPGRPDVLLDLWAVLLAAVLTAPLLLTRGRPLAGDMVFVDAQPFGPAALGIGDGPPRAAPLDAAVALVGAVVGGDVLARVAVVGGLVLAGAGAHRLLRRSPVAGRAAATAFAVWNPFVVERLALGQWALLLAYAAGFPLLGAAVRFRRSAGGWRAVAGVVPWAALAALTPTGGVLAGVLALSTGARPTLRHLGPLVAAVLVVQLPWVVPALVAPTVSGASLTGDPAGVGAFAARAERPGGVGWSLLGLGGVWDAGSVPASRSGVLGHVGSLLVVAAVVGGWPSLRRAVGTVTAGRLAWLAVAGLVLAGASSTPWGAAALRWAVVEVPGAGLLRDAQKWLVPLAWLAVLGLGCAVGALVEGVRSRRAALAPAVAVLLAGLPVAVLADAPGVTWPTVRPVVEPVDVAAVAEIVDGKEGDVVSLPWELYRRFPWGSERTVHDPASRWFDATVVTSDRLRVGSQLLAAEGPRSASLGAVLAEPGVDADALARNGVRWVLVQADAQPAARVPTGVVPRYEGEHLALYEVPPWSASAEGSSRAATAALVAVAFVDVVVVLVVLLALGVVAAARVRTRRSR